MTFRSLLNAEQLAKITNEEKSDRNLNGKT